MAAIFGQFPANFRFSRALFGRFYKMFMFGQSKLLINNCYRGFDVVCVF